jgi:hypothetical protein
MAQKIFHQLLLQKVSNSFPTCVHHLYKVVQQKGLNEISYEHLLVVRLVWAQWTVSNRHKIQSVRLPPSYFSGLNNRLATGCTFRGSNPGGGEIFSTRPGRPQDPPTLLYNGYRVIPGVKRPRRGINHPPPYSVEVEEKIELQVGPVLRRSILRLFTLTTVIYTIILNISIYLENF